ncbi:MAG: hypothetical protein IPF66_18755 [Holophagales bacterium]|nr:hypothetical protein [Holophagales bacterium]
MTPAPRVRFAPSPTGSLHVGGARTASTTGSSPAATAAPSSSGSRTPTSTGTSPSSSTRSSRR